MRSILPSLKENKRYVLFRILSEAQIDKSKCEEAILSACQRFLGELGCARAGVLFLQETYDSKAKTGIIRVSTKSVDELKVALATVEQIDTHSATFDILKASGNINKLKG